MILVVGSSGFLGGLIARRLLEQGKSVRILRRSNPTYQALVNAGAEAIWGDLKDRASLDTACKGVETVITTANAALRGGGDTFESVDLQGTMNLIDAAKANGVQQFIYISAYGSGAQSSNALLNAKGRCEDYLRQRGMTFTILKPHIFIEIWVGAVVGIPLKAGAPVTLVEQGSKRHSFVSVPDVAEVTVATVGHPSALNQEIAIGGTRSVSWTEFVEITSQVIERPLAIQYVKMGERVPLLPASMMELLYATESYATDIDMTQVCQTFGVTSPPPKMRCDTSLAVLRLTDKAGLCGEKSFGTK